MVPIGIYLFFIGSLSGYRYSKYWPKEITGISWVAQPWVSVVSILSGFFLLLIEKGWASGILLALCIYMAVLSCIIFFVNCNRRVRLAVVILFHLLCLVGVIFKL